jgi:hypothetical protein
MEMHVGSKQGTSEPARKSVPVDQGDFVITDKAIYFGGMHEVFHLLFEKIGALNRIGSDGIVILKDSSAATSAKPWALYFPDAWFAYQLLTTLMQSEDDEDGTSKPPLATIRSLIKDSKGNVVNPKKGTEVESR